MPYQGIIFDLDGTLIDTVEDIAAAANAVRREFGATPLPAEVIRGFIGEGARVLVRRALGDALADHVDSGLEIFLRTYGEHLCEHSRPYPGCKEMLVRLADAGHVLSILTNKPEAHTRGLLGHLALDRFFRVVVGGDTLSTRKPDPAGVRHICSVTGVPGERCVLVGDSVVDLHTARAAGVDFLGVRWGFGREGLEEEGVVLHSRIDSLLQVLG